MFKDKFYKGTGQIVNTLDQPTEASISRASGDILGKRVLPDPFKSGLLLTLIANFHET